MEHGRLLSARAQSPLPVIVLVLVLACCLIASSRLALSQHLSKRSISAAHALAKSFLVSRRVWRQAGSAGWLSAHAACGRERRSGMHIARARGMQSARRIQPSSRASHRLHLLQLQARARTRARTHVL